MTPGNGGGPPAAPGCWTVVQWLLGALVGFFAAVLSLTLALPLMSTDPAGACRSAVLVGVVGFLIMIAVLWATWRFVVRPRGGRRSPFVSGMLVAAAVYLVIPWPCSTGWAGAYLAAQSCGHQRTR